METSIYQSIPVDILKKGTKRNVDRSPVCKEYEFFRLSSFASFPQTSGGRPLKLAKAGFLFTPLHPDDDTVTCFSCQVTRNNWMRFEDPMEFHKSLSPECEFIKGKSDNVEIPIPKDDVYQKIKTTLREMYSKENNEENSCPPIDGGSDDNDISSSPSELASHPHRNIPTNGPVVPNKWILEKRLESFRNWPREDSPPSKEALAKAGFIYTGHEDIVKCFFCGGYLKAWENNDVPWEEHARWFPTCPYLVRIKGQKFINTYHRPDHDRAQKNAGDKPGGRRRSHNDDDVNLRCGKKRRDNIADHCSGDSIKDHCHSDSSDDHSPSDCPQNGNDDHLTRDGNSEDRAIDNNQEEFSGDSHDYQRASDNREICCSSVGDDDTLNSKQN